MGSGLLRRCLNLTCGGGPLGLESNFKLTLLDMSYEYTCLRNINLSEYTGSRQAVGPCECALVDSQALETPALSILEDSPNYLEQSALWPPYQ